MHRGWAGIRAAPLAFIALLPACSTDLFHDTEWPSGCHQDPSATGCHASGAAAGGAGGRGVGGAGGSGGQGPTAWSHALGDALDQTASAVKRDASGDVVVVGDFAGRLDLGGSKIDSAGVHDVFVARFDAAGTLRWLEGFGDASEQRGADLALDAAGNTVIAGHFEGSIDFSGNDPITSKGGQDIFVAKLDPSGASIWKKRFGDTANQRANAVALDALGNAYVVGTFEGTVTFGNVLLTSEGGADAFIVKLDPTGAMVWAKRFGSTLNQQATSVTVAPNGSVILAGQYVNSIDFGGGALAPAAAPFVFVTALDSSGAYQWSAGFGAPNSLASVSVAADSSGAVLVTGGFGGTMTLGTDLASAGGMDVFLAKLDGGKVVWSKSFGDPAEQKANAIAVDAEDRILLTGSIDGTTDFGGGALVGAGMGDVFLARFDPAGEHLYSAPFGDALEQLGTGVATAGSDAIVVVGSFDGQLDLGGQPLDSSNDPGAHDVFVAEIVP